MNEINMNEINNEYEYYINQTKNKIQTQNTLKTIKEIDEYEHDDSEDEITNCRNKFIKLSYMIIITAFLTFIIFVVI